jgi:hypothetical protein
MYLVADRNREGLAHRQQVGIDTILLRDDEHHPVSVIVQYKRHLEQEPVVLQSLAARNEVRVTEAGFAESISQQ